MFAVVEIAGQQYTVTKSDKIYVPKMESEVGSKVKIEHVLLLGDKKETKIGTPHISGASVEAKVLEHVRDDKVIVFKKKRRKGYRVLRGHRQHYTHIQITNVG